MIYKEFQPAHLLKEFVQCYFSCENDAEGQTDDQVFASGNIEIMFNLQIDQPQTLTYGNTVINPAAQLWGQTIKPLSFTAASRHFMLGIRFFPHTAAYFLDNPIADFNDRIVDYNDYAGTDALLLHERLLDTDNLPDRLSLLDQYLIKKLYRSGAKPERVGLLNSICKTLYYDESLQRIRSVASDHGMSSRNLQKIFSAYTGLSPKLFYKITRFRRSLELLTLESSSLTSTAHQCGYFDQSHFIKDFKAFTGTIPSHFLPETSTDLVVPLQN